MYSPPIQMLDSHQNETECRAHLAEVRGRRVAVSPREELEQWLKASHPVLSVNELDETGPIPRITRTSVVTLSGVECAQLFEDGHAAGVTLL